MSVTWVIIISAILLAGSAICLEMLRRGEKVSDNIKYALTVLGMVFATLLLAIGVKLIMIGG